MSDVVENQSVFSFNWEIENFSLLPKLSPGILKSLVFTVNNFYFTRWYLQLDFGSYPGKFRLYLRNYLRESRINLSYELSILSTDVSKLISKTVSEFQFLSNRNSREVPLEIEHHELFSKKKILPGDTLILQCRMWYHTQVCLEPGFCLARTRIGSERKNFTWAINDFSNLQINDEKSTVIRFHPNLKLSLSLILFVTGTTDHEKKVRIKIESNNDETCDFLIMLEISIQNINGKVMYRADDEFKLSNGKEKRQFPLMWEMKRLLLNKDMLFPNDVLSLNCILVISKYSIEDAVVLNEIEHTTFGVDALPDLKETITDTNKSLSLGNEVYSTPSSLTNDMMHLFRDKYLADIKLRVHGEIFPVHKAILAARSSVFKTMFEADMKEKFTSTIDIEDFEPETIRRLLVYIYSNVWENNIDWENASNLCLAAEKYAILCLKERCFSFLKKQIVLSNVFKILVLADMLRDEELKSSAQNFIQKNNVIDSNEWKQFSQEHPQLTIEILTSLYKESKA